jgi:hypothetical protein
VLVGLVRDLNDALGELLLAGGPAPDAPASAGQTAAHTDALERVPGVPPSSTCPLILVDALTT